MARGISLRFACFACLLFAALWAAGLLGSAAAFADAQAGTHSSSSSSDAATAQVALAADSAGTVFSDATQLQHQSVSGDLFWGNTDLSAQTVSVDGDLIGAAGSFAANNTQVGGNIRFAARKVAFDRVVTQRNAILAGAQIAIDSQSKARGVYCAAADVDFQGTARYLVVYANRIYFDGTVNGDVTLSAQDIQIGPHAKVTGTLNVRSGQTPEVPSTAHIAAIDTSLNNPTAIDQVSQLRATIAPFFQVGSILFIVIACALMALLMLWVGERQLEEANRTVRRRPFGHLVLGLLTVLGLVVAMVACIALVFTIPAGLVLLFLLLAALLACVPFTGASLGLLLPRFPRGVKAMLGAGLGGALLFVPYVQWIAVAFSLVYLSGYIARSVFVGHDAEYLWALKEHRDSGGKSAESESDLQPAGTAEKGPSA